MKENITHIHSSKRVRRTRQGVHHASSTPSLGWVWLLSGIFIGIIAVILIHAGMNNPQAIGHLKTLALHRTSNPSANVKSDTQRSVPKTQEVAKKYEFYTLLPGMEVQLPPTSAPRTPPLAASPVIAKPVASVPKPTVAVALNKVSVKPVTPSKPLRSVAPAVPLSPTVQSGLSDVKIHSKLAAAHYIVQAGVFALPADAKELAAHIGSKGFKPTLHTVKMRNGITAYRVILGPYPTEVVALNYKKRLEQNKIHGILILKR